MTRRTLPQLGMPRTTAEFAHKAYASARRRRLQMMPGHGPKSAPGEERVAHYQGMPEEAVLGPEPDDLLNDRRNPPVR